MPRTPSHQEASCRSRGRLGASVSALIILALTGSCTREESPELPTPPGAGIHLDAEVVTAIENAREQVQADPTDSESWLRLGMTYEANGLPQQATESYEATVHLASENARAWYRLGVTRSQLGDLDRAVAALERAGTIDAEYPPIAWQRGFWRLETGDLEGAERDFRIAARLEPNGFAGSTGLARVALQRGEGEAAAELLKGLLARASREPYYHQLLGKAYLSLGRTEEAQRALKRGGGRPMPRFEDPWQREVDEYAAGFAGERDRALTAFAEGRLTEAMDQLRLLLQERPGDGALSYAMAVACMHSGRTAEAIEVLEAGVAHNPGHNLLFVALSDAFRQAGDLERALEHAEKAVALNPALFMTHFRLAGVLEALGRRQEALEVGVRALARDPDSVTGLNWLGNLQSVLGRWQEAADTYEHLIQLEPEQPGFWLGLGFARLRLGEFEEAEAAMVEATRLGPDGWQPARRLQAELLRLQADRDRR